MSLTRWHRITFPAGLWLMAQVGLLMLGAVSAESKASFSLAHGIKTRVEIQQIKCRNVQHPLILK